MVNIAILGSGIVGFSTGKGFINLGHDAIFCDVLKERLNKLKDEGYETELNIKEAVLKTDISFICINTPTDNGLQDKSNLMNAIQDIVHALNSIKKYHLIVFRSTLLPGTMRKEIVKYFDQFCVKKRGKEYDVCYNPEFLRQDTAVKDFEHPDRIIIGEDTKDSSMPLVDLYKPLTDKIIVTTFECAEMIKYASNCFLSLKISFFNEIGMMCEKLNIDDKIVSYGTSLDKRIGEYGIHAGRPFGGPCLPKDTEAFASFVKKLEINPDLIRVVLDINKEIASKKTQKQIQKD